MSYGQGKQDVDAPIADITNKLLIAYVHHNLTPNAVLTFEYDHFQADSSALATPTSSSTQTKYDLFSVGFHFYF